jgi:exodeoxyribonuclease VII large subunit
VAGLGEGIRLRVSSAVSRSDERLHERARRVQRGAQRVLERADGRLAAAATSVRRAPQRMDLPEQQLQHVAERVRLLDPATTMARGWSITRTIDGRTIRAADELQSGEQIITTFASGTARSRVEETNP